uniref:SVWC domain-containing protein n=1 Tax=Steinernema glaseri TaxID=37863 RepID=A0A1I7ZJK9_9BILA
MKTKVLVLISLALFLAAPQVAGTHCYHSDSPCEEGFVETDSKFDEDGETKMCCDEPSEWPIQDGCYQRLSLFGGCPNGYEQNPTWFTSTIKIWCCLVTH